ncbi:MAG: tetratricopeptide repeat protein, partial [Planctomycetes bacterium]|nr:tetratricopeptide repeat protein [Planctomycetota bacterium]
RQGGVAISGLRGMGGIGKTALALVLAERLAGAYPAGQFYFDLCGADAKHQTPRTPVEAMRHVLFGYDPTRALPDDEDGLRALYLSELSDRPALLLMDNAANAEQVKPLIPPNGCLLLVTSRQHFVLPGLAPLNIDTLREDRACELLLKICSRIADQADEIAKLCGYLPLALRVAASTLAERPAMSPETYVKRLTKNRLEQLNEVDAAIAVSEDLLPDERREHFRALSVFPESFERSGAARLLELEPNASDDELDALVACSLLQWDKESERYNMHDLVRLFADDRLTGDRRVALQLRHAQVYCEVLAAADDLYLQGGEKTYEGLSLFDREWGNIQAGFARVSARATVHDQEADLCSRYLNAGVYCLRIRQSTDERIAWLEAGVSAAQRLKDAPMEASHLSNLGLIFKRRGDLDEAEKMLRKSLEINEKLGRLEGMASDYCNLGLIFKTRGDLDEAEKMFRKSLEIDEKLGRLEGMANQNANLGLIFKTRGDLEEARKLWTKARDLFAKIGMPHMVEKVVGWLNELPDEDGDGS